MCLKTGGAELGGMCGGGVVAGGRGGGGGVVPDRLRAAVADSWGQRPVQWHSYVMCGMSQPREAYSLRTQPRALCCMPGLNSSYSLPLLLL